MNNTTRLLSKCRAIFAAREESNRRELEVPDETYEQTAARMAGWLDKPSHAELAQKYGHYEPEQSEEDELNELFPRGE